MLTILGQTQLGHRARHIIDQRSIVLGCTKLGQHTLNLAQIFRGAIRLFPALLRQPVLRTWAGLRPLTADGRPIVGAHPEVERLWYATGHGRNGVLLAALTGEIVGDLLSAGETAVDVAAWRPDRPGALAA